MAIRLMLDHGIRRKSKHGSYVSSQALLKPPHVEKNIVFLSFLAAPQGLTTVHSAFPGVRVVTASVGEKIEEREFPVHEHVVLGNVVRGADSGSHQAERTDRSSGRTNKGTSETESGTKHAWVITPGKFHMSLRTDEKTNESELSRQRLNRKDIGNPGSRYFGV